MSCHALPSIVYKHIYKTTHKHLPTDTWYKSPPSTASTPPPNQSTPNPNTWRHTPPASSYASPIERYRWFRFPTRDHRALPRRLLQWVSPTVLLSELDWDFSNRRWECHWDPISNRSGWSSESVVCCRGYWGKRYRWWMFRCRCSRNCRWIRFDDDRSVVDGMMSLVGVMIVTAVLLEEWVGSLL